MVEGFKCPCDPRSCVVGGKEPLVGSPKVTWSQGSSQTKTHSEGCDEKYTKVLKYLAQNRDTVPWGLARVQPEETTTQWALRPQGRALRLKTEPADSRLGSLVLGIWNVTFLAMKGP